MTIKVNYDIETTLVKGYYPSTINYASIPEPYIEISDGEHQEALGKQMCVVNGDFQEYVKPDSVLLEEKKIEKIAQCELELAKTDWQANAYLKRNRLIDSWVAKRDQDIVDLMRQITACTTLEELNNINIDFS